MKCRKCGEKFHYCGSCGYDQANYEGFCSDKCYEESDDFIENKTAF